MEKQKTQNIQHKTEKEQTQRTRTTQLQDLLYNYSSQDDMVLVKEQTHRIIKQRASKQTHKNIVNRFLTKDQKQFNGENIVFSSNSAGTIRQILESKKKENTLN